MLVKEIAVDLTSCLKIHGTDCIEYSRRMITRGVPDLASVSRVMEEVARPRLTHEPINRSLDSQSAIVNIGTIARRILRAYCAQWACIDPQDHLEE